jgi:hypothetical protein
VTVSWWPRPVSGGATTGAQAPATASAAAAGAMRMVAAAYPVAAFGKIEVRAVWS